MRRARVSIMDNERRHGATVVTDESGRFTFKSVPAGRYSITPMKAAWVGTTYGATRPNRPGTPITVADGQHVDKLTIRLARGAVITGTVTDELRASDGQGIGHGVPIHFSGRHADTDPRRAHRDVRRSRCLPDLRAGTRTISGRHVTSRRDRPPRRRVAADHLRRDQRALANAVAAVAARPITQGRPSEARRSPTRPCSTPERQPSRRAL